MAKREADEAVEQNVDKKLKSANKNVNKMEDLLAQITLAQLTKEHRKEGFEIISLEHNSLISEALETLASYNILSAPILMGATVEEENEGTYIGIVDVSTLLHAFVDGVLDGDLSDEAKLMGKWETFANRMLITVSGHDANLVYKGEEFHTLLETIREGFSEGTHRIAVFDAHGKVIDVVSQTDVIRLLHKREDALGEVASTSIKDLGCVNRQVKTVPDTESAAQVFKLLDDKHISGIGIVDGDGKLVSNLSRSDLRGLKKDDVKLLTKTVMQFIDELWQRARLQADGNDDIPEKPYMVTMREGDTLRDVLRTMVDEHVHRVYIVNDEGQPTGIVTPTDVLRALVSTEASAST